MADQEFVGSIPEIYDRCLGPMLFEPYARDLAARLAALDPAARSAASDLGSRAASDLGSWAVLELAAGTGIATAGVARAMPAGTRIMATDLNQPMLDLAARRRPAPGVEFRTADAQDLPFADGEFHVVVCQFGVMFLPGKERAYREMRRVLAPGGTLLFSVWDRVEASPIVDEVVAALGRWFPADPPRFIVRTPHGYHDPASIRDALGAAGFDDITVEAVTLPCEAPSARAVAAGFCQGTPTRHEIVERDEKALPAVTDAVERAVAERFGDGPVRSTMTAFVVTAR